MKSEISNTEADTEMLLRGPFLCSGRLPILLGKVDRHKKALKTMGN